MNTNIENCNTIGGLIVTVVEVPNNYEGDTFCGTLVQKIEDQIPTVQKTPNDDGEKNENKGEMKTGTIIAIAVVVGVVVIAAVVITLVIINMKKKGSKKETINSKLFEEQI